LDNTVDQQQQQIADQAGQLVQPEGPSTGAAQQAAPENPDAIMQEYLQGQTQQQGTPQGQPPADGGTGGMTPQQIDQARYSGPLGAINSFLEPGPKKAFEGGMAQGLYNMKDAAVSAYDWATGRQPSQPQDKSSLRNYIDTTTNEAGQGSMFSGFSQGMGQFVIGMIGVGKLGEATKAIGWVGAGADALAATKYGGKALEIGKAALAGALAFDPHQENIMNLVQGTALENPLSTALAAKPDDTEAMGRLKNAMTSIGMDVALQGAFMGGIKIFRYLNHGDAAGAKAAAGALEAEMKNNVAQEQQANVPPAPTGNPSEGLQPVPQGVPANSVEHGATPVPAGPSVLSNEVQAAPPSTRSGATLEAANSNAPASPLGTPSGPVGTGREALPNVGPRVGEGLPPEPSNANIEGGGQPLAPPANPRKSPLVSFSDENTKAVLDKATADANAVQENGSYLRAMAAGHEFSDGDGIPYHKLTTSNEVDDLFTRAVDEAEAQLNDLKGGAVMSDARVEKTVKYYAEVTGRDEGQLLGLVQQSGTEAPKMVARMQVGYVMAQKAFMDAYKLNERFRLGDFTGFASSDDMFKQIQHRMSVATSYYGAARSMTANFGRGLRRMKTDFKFDPSLYKDVDPKVLSEVLSAGGANPAALKIFAQPTALQRVGDFLQLLRINSLVSGPKTQLINMATSSYMTLARPLERILGAGANMALGGGVKANLGIMSQSLRQYVYMGSSLYDGFMNAGKAFVRNDSVLNPHNMEVYGQAGDATKQLRRVAPGAQPIAEGFFKPATSISNITYNALSAPGLLASVPNRLLGSADELLKTITYRSKVMANAYGEAFEQTAGKGLTYADQKAAMESYVKQRLRNAFDDAGEATDKAALLEAQTATFTQDLGQGTLGRGIQTLTQNYAPARFIIPFIKTPTNVIRYGWKMTPGLNLLQGEFRNSLLGNLGKEAQAQASGQMMLGMLFMGSAAHLASQGMITGGGPKDPKAKAEMVNAGWQPYSYRYLDAEGKPHYVQFNRFDPVAIPFGMVADIHDALHASEWDGTDANLQPAIESAIGAVGIAMAKQFASKSYLLGIQQTMDALMDPENKGQNAAGSMLGSFVPYSAFGRQVAGDDYQRDARSVVDRALMSVPGYAAGVPMRYNWLGEPAINRNGLGISTTGSGLVVDNEMIRLAQQTGTFLSRPSAIVNGVDLRNITMVDGKNAYEEYQRLTGRPVPNARSLRLQVQRVMLSKAYANAPDGDSNLKGTRLNLLANVLSKYHEAARKEIMRDANVQKAFQTPVQQVQDHYRELKGLPPKVPAKGTGLDAIGKAFGVDLSSPNTQN
jgi:hypothetical protein